MIDMTRVAIRRVNEIGIAYGEPFEADDLPYAVAEAVETAIVETDEDEGEVEVSGRRYCWSRGAAATEQR